MGSGQRWNLFRKGAAGTRRVETKESPDLERKTDSADSSRHILQGAAGTAMHVGSQLGASGARLSRSGEPRHHRHDVLAHNDLLHEYTSPLWKQGRKHEALFF